MATKDDELKSIFSQRLRDLVQSRGYSKKELVKMLGVSSQQYWNWENGIHIPETIKLIELSNVLSTSVGYLLGCENEPVENAFDISKKTGLSEENISFLVRHVKATGYMELLNTILSNHAFIQALESVGKAQSIQQRLKGRHIKTEGITIEQARTCIKTDNLYNTSMVLADGVLVRDYHISHATKCMETLFDYIVKGDNENGKYNGKKK